VQQESQTTLGRALLLLRLLVPDRLLNWRLTTMRLVWIIRGLILLGLLLAIGAPYNKGLWDWLDLLIVPAAIAVGVVLLDQRQRARDQAAEQDRQRRQEQEMEEQRDRELQVEDPRAQDAALQAYLDKMDEMIDRLRSITAVAPDVDQVFDIQTLIRARTLTVLERLDESRKRALMRFLVELAFLHRDREPPITLFDANLERADLSGMNLGNTKLQGVRLNHANLSGANLEGTDFRDAILSHADLSGARLGTARQLTVLPNGGTELAKPNPADLREADLSHADLTKAVGWTHEQLDSAKSLEGATMPDGSTLP
jgi:Pentapeptide repeats (8 copies)